MRGAEDAQRDAAERLRRTLLPCAECTWALAGDIAERAAEGAKALPARAESDIGDGEIGVEAARLPAQRVA